MVRKKVQEALKLSEEQFRKAIEDAPIPIIMHAEDGQVLLLSRTWTELTGYHINDVPDFDTWLTKTVYGEGANAVRDHMRALFDGQKKSINVEFPVRALDGSVRFWSFSASSPGTLMDGRRFIVGMAVDITDRKKAQEALKESEQRWATTLASVGDAVIATDLAGRITFMNGVAEELTGWTLIEALKKPVKEILHIINEQTRIIVENPIDRALKEGVIVGLANHTVLLRKDGSEVPIDDSGAPIKDKDGNTTGVVLIFRDITERKKGEKILEEYRGSLEKLAEEQKKKLGIASLYARNLIEASLDPLVTVSKDGKIIDVNKATEDVTGYSHEELVGSDFWVFFTEPEEVLNVHKKVFTEGFVKDISLGMKHKTGRITKVVYNALIYRNPEGEIQGVFAAARDTTELRKAQEEARESTRKLKEAERLAAIGTTAGMVGHDIRNPLQAIASDVYLAETDLAGMPEGEAKEGMKESLAGIEKNVEYIDKIVQDLQDFARPLNPKIEESDLKQILEAMISKNGIPENVKVKIDVDESARKIRADAYYLNRILSNLVTNSVQAMPKGGKLTIKAYKEAGDPILSVQDTGVGIPKNIQDKMFNVMFTTKSKGQGFGLPVVKRMTESLGGNVSFKSEEGKGTTFTIRLPPPKS
jgi:PAS domain S-box-containing protein